MADQIDKSASVSGLPLPREWRQDDLFEMYREVCLWAGYSPCGLRQFTRQTKETGCRRWQADFRYEGPGDRPVMVEIPATVIMRRDQGPKIKFVAGGKIKAVRKGSLPHPAFAVG